MCHVHHYVMSTKNESAMHGCALCGLVQYAIQSNIMLLKLQWHDRIISVSYVTYVQRCSQESNCAERQHFVVRYSRSVACHRES